MALAPWFIRTMRGADTTLALNKPVSSLVQDGPFRCSRNSGYLSLAMIYAGIATLRNALWPILLLPLVLVVTQRELIEREERFLERTFERSTWPTSAGFAAGCSNLSFRKRRSCEVPRIYLPRTGVKIALAAAPFSWFRGGPARRAMGHFGE